MVNSKKTAVLIIALGMLFMTGVPGAVVIAQPPPPPTPPPPGGAGAPCPSPYFKVCNDINGPSCIPANQCTTCTDTSGNPACSTTAYIQSNCASGTECQVGGSGATCANAGCVAGEELCTNSGTCVPQGTCSLSFCGTCPSCACPTGQVNPHKECQAGSCVDVNTCGVSVDCTICGGGGGSLCSGTNCAACSQTQCALTSGCTWTGFACSVSGSGGGGAGVGTGGTLPTIPEPKLTSINDFYIALKAIAQWILVFGIILGVIFILLGAISILTSHGEDQKVTTGKKTITWAVVGVILLILAYAIVNIVAKFLGSAGNVISP